MKYVILGAGAAGITAARTLRKGRKEDSIRIISTDDRVHSRCMLHKYLSHERDEKELNFVPEDFFCENNIEWMPGCTAVELDTSSQKLVLDNGQQISYDKLLIATGAESFIPPVGKLREASNVFGLRHLRDARAIDKKAEVSSEIAIIGSGLVGLDAACGLMEQGKQVTVIEMADQILPIQLDEKGAKEYQKRFENAGCRFFLGRKAQDTLCNEKGEVTRLLLDNGEEIPCDMVIVAAGVRPGTAGMDGEGIRIDRGIQVNEYLQTDVPDIYAAGDVTGLSGIWPNAMKQGETAALNMMGSAVAYTDTFAIKNTINFFGLASLCVGVIKPEENDVVIAREDARNYKRIILRNGKVAGVLIQGDIAHAGIWQYLIKNQIPVASIKKDIFELNFSDFYGIQENGEFVWKVS